MADSTSQELIVRSGSQVSLAPSATGPVARMISEALVVIATRETPADAARPRVLIADTDRALVRYLGDLLSPNFAVASVEAPAAFAEAIAASEFDVIIANSSLFGADGVPIYLWIRSAHPALSERTIFTIDTMADEGAVITTAESGGTVLRKPVRLDQWDQAILSVLKRVSPARFRSLESVFAL